MLLGILQAWELLLDQDPNPWKKSMLRSTLILSPHSCLLANNKFNIFLYYSSGPQTPVGATEAAQDPGPSNQERVEVPHNERTPQSIPEIEVMRDATIDYRPEDILFWPDQRDDQMEPDKYLMAIIKENDNHIPEVELQSGGSSIPSAPCREPVSAASEQGLETLDSHDAFGRFKKLFCSYLQRN